MKTLGYISAFIGGAIAGAALGILMAPEKGSDTRTKISDAVDDFCNKHDIKLAEKKQKNSLKISKTQHLIHFKLKKNVLER